MMDDDEQTYSGCNHGHGPGIHVSTGNPSFILRLGKRQWRTEWHYYFGPSVVKQNGDPIARQLGERSPWWIIATWWKHQGCRVVDGVGLWDYPETEVMTCAKTGKEVTYWMGYLWAGPAREL